MLTIIKFKRYTAGRFHELLHIYVLRSLHVDLELKYGTQKLKEQPVNVLFVLKQNNLF